MQEILSIPPGCRAGTQMGDRLLRVHTELYLWVPGYGMWVAAPCHLPRKWLCPPLMFGIKPWDTTTSLYQGKRPLKTGSQMDLLLDCLQIHLLKVFSNPHISSQGPCKLPSQPILSSNANFYKPMCQERILLWHWRNCHFKTRQKSCIFKKKKNLRVHELFCRQQWSYS